MWKPRFISTVLMCQNWSMQSFKSKPGVDIVVVVDAVVVDAVVVDAVVVVVFIVDGAFVMTSTKDKKFINKYSFKITKL